MSRKKKNKRKKKKNNSNTPNQESKGSSPLSGDGSRGQKQHSPNKQEEKTKTSQPGLCSQQPISLVWSESSTAPESLKGSSRKTCIELLQRCDHRRHLGELRRLHSHLLATGVAHQWIFPSELIRLYGRCGSVSDALTVFRSVRDPEAKLCQKMLVAHMENGDLVGAERIFDMMPPMDVNASNTMIVAYGRYKAVHKARSLFERMEKRNDITWTAMVAVLAQNGHSRDSKKLFEKMPLLGVVPCTCMISAYAQQGHLKDSWRMFKEMKSRDVYAWTALLTVLYRNSLLAQARTVFDRMPKRSRVSWTSCVTAYAKNGELHQARKLFNQMPDPDVVTWTSLITAYAQAGESREALEMFKRMDLEGIEADRFTFSIALDACANLSDVTEGEVLHRSILDSGGVDDVVVGNSLLNMYGKCGQLEDAVGVFRGMSYKVVATWNALIAAYTENGWHQSAFETFGRLNQEGGVEPDSITFIGMLKACSHNGKLGDSREYFLSMMRDFSLPPNQDHYVCISDLLARLGRLGESEELISNMPFYPHPVAWLSLMGSCRTHLNPDIAERAAEHLYVWDPESPSPYILLSNIYAALGRNKDVLRIRRLMKIRGVKNNQGLSYIQVKGKLLPFAVGRWTTKLYKQFCK